MEFRALARRARPGAGALLAFGASLAACLPGPYMATSGDVSTGDTTAPDDSTTTTSGASTTDPQTGADTTGADTAGTTGPASTGTGSSTSAPARCGDGVVGDGEECDDGDLDDADACLSTCVAAVCGDGLVHDGVEECDDGNLSDIDGCTSNCQVQVCGDGVVQSGETCDDADTDDTDECPTNCQEASCGDGFPWDGVEICDAGMDSPFCDGDCTLPECGDSFTNPAAGEQCDSGGEATAECDPDCSFPACGDGLLSDLSGEECDDGNAVGGDGCSAACVKERRVVFVSSVLYTGNLGGLAGADAKCQQLAQAAGLSGSFKAWLSDAQASPQARFLKSTVPYVLPDGQQVAKSWTDLTDGVLVHAIDQTEQETAPPAAMACNAKPTVWTNTREDGTAWSGSICGNFTNTTGDGRFGTSAAINFTWTRSCSGAPGTCAWKAPIYCFEQ